MPALTGPLDALAVVLLLAGVAKLARPEPTVPALRAVGLGAASPTVVRMIGTTEVVVAAVVLAFGGAVAAGVTAVLYAGFALFALALLRSQEADADCGCFGHDSAPVTGIHVLVNAVAALVALGAVAAPVPPVIDALDELGWAAPAFALLVLVGAMLVRAVLTSGAELQLAMRDLREAAG